VLTEDAALLSRPWREVWGHLSGVKAQAQFSGGPPGFLSFTRGAPLLARRILSPFGHSSYFVERLHDGPLHAVHLAHVISGVAHGGRYKHPHKPVYLFTFFLRGAQWIDPISSILMGLDRV
jgi:hypothetical protein